MRFHVVATDYDGTLAERGRLAGATIDALRRVRTSGRKVVLVTGRQLDDVLALVPDPLLFDQIVAENGAIMYAPRARERHVLCAPPPPAFADELRRRGIAPLHIGRVIVATTEPWHELVLETIRSLGLELQVIFNKGAVMVLPTGVNKATGLAAALGALGCSRHNVVAVGDAENDHALLELAECGAAVAGALPALRAHADLVLASDAGGGVVELIDRLVATDLAGVPLPRRRIALGQVDGATIDFDPYAQAILACGPSSSGKSTLVGGIIENLTAAGYQVAVIDPEGDHATFDVLVALGSPSRAPLVEEALEVLRDPANHVVVNLLGVPLEDRPDVARQLFAAFAELRARTGRPHWIVVEEAHHMLPPGDRAGPAEPPRRGVLFVTVHPELLAPDALAAVDLVLATGERPETRVRAVAAIAGRPAPRMPERCELTTGHALMWRADAAAARVIETVRPTGEHRRHSRKYSEGVLGDDRSFFFRGSDGRLSLRASNLAVFLELGDGVDADTWLFHLRRGDYSRWLRDAVKDRDLADEVARVEAACAGSATESRRRIRAAIEARYTLPAYAGARAHVDE